MVETKTMTKYTNPCPTYDTCSASYCPEVNQGHHADGDEICFRLGANTIQKFNRSAKDAADGEIQGLIRLAYENKKAKKA
jgi:hypothetical protein